MQNGLLKELKEKGYRITKVRSFIVEYLASHKKPVDALVIQSKLAQLVKKVNKTTIYREIDFLLSQGIIKEVHFGDSKKRYEIANLPHHHHLVCKGCDGVQDVILKNELETVEQEIARKSKFKIENHTLEFFGVCSKCLIQ